MKSIPRKAMPVVKVLRRDVKRPEKLPIPEDPNFPEDSICLRWDNRDCPMGLHPKSLNGTPTATEEFADGECTDKQVEEFLNWWDNLEAEDAKPGMDAIWGDTDEQV